MLFFFFSDGVDSIAITGCECGEHPWRWWVCGNRGKWQLTPEGETEHLYFNAELGQSNNILMRFMLPECVFTCRRGNH